MQIVIDIPEETYEKCKRIGDMNDTLFEAIRKGIVLPPDHGDLIDAGMVIELLCMDKCTVRPNECPWSVPCGARYVVDKIAEHAIVPREEVQR